MQVSVRLTNIGTADADFKATIDCQMNDGAFANYYYHNDQKSIVALVGKDAFRDIVFNVVLESNSLPNLTMSCSVVAMVARPSICWAGSFTNKAIFNLPLVAFPYDPCVSQRQQPYIEVSEDKWRESNDNTLYFGYLFSLDLAWKTISVNPVPSAYPLAHDVSDPHAMSEPSYPGTDLVYINEIVTNVTNAGTLDSMFNITLLCPPQIFFDNLEVSRPWMSIIEANTYKSIRLFVLSKATSLERSGVQCSMTIEVTDLNACWNEYGKSYKQDVMLYPPFDKTVGNWYQPSLFESIAYWKDGSHTIPSLTSSLGSWTIDTSSLSTRRYVIGVHSNYIVNMDYGVGNLTSTLQCTGYATIIQGSPLLTTCLLEYQQGCYINYQVQALPTSTHQSIQCTLTVAFKPLFGTQYFSSATPPLSLQQSTTVSLQTPIDPCLAGSYQEVFIEAVTNNSQLSPTLQNNQWTYDSASLVAKTVRRIGLYNSGGGSGLISANVSISDSLVSLVVGESTTSCMAQAYSYCLLEFVLSMTSLDVPITSPPQFVLIDVTSVVQPQECWTLNNKVVNQQFNLVKAVTPCQQNSEASLTPIDVHNDYINYFKSIINAYNVFISPWNKTDSNQPLNQQIYQAEVSSQILNRGNATGILFVSVFCNNNPVKTNLRVLDTYNVTNTALLVQPLSSVTVNFTLETDKIEQPDGQTISCFITATLNRERCWSGAGKNLTQSFSVPYQRVVDITPPDEKDDNLTHKIIMGVTIPLGLIWLVLLSTFFVAYRHQIASIFDKLKRQRKLKAITSVPSAAVVGTGLGQKPNCNCGKPSIFICSFCHPPNNVYCSDVECWSIITSGSMANINDYDPIQAQEYLDNGNNQNKQHIHPHPTNQDFEINHLHKQFHQNDGPVIDLVNIGLQETFKLNQIK
ncbi:hypothetical protein DFA_06858 [Cavenderia fasciculata]|uniref:Generative cell specific-1/HAP2 domain-containing protein n=1 Tax=Cavenderia fasciculata TaxID=261658 RepID=F4PWV5_CACFS|nr:uncharacterized protein DFA_06858 [Cavenderia fasciculata]EGG19758.1 hypothetical protein DFA_06858 [Cavenderia fasciculata]|eukprot:XP_004358104.1 hypothetical protein DFA_06858 [Cavenderia fasciculata]